MQNKYKIILSLIFTVLFVSLFYCDKSNPVDNTGGTVTDADGNEYTTVIIGNQEWTVENLRTTKYNDGSTIPHVSDSTQWVGLSTPGYCFYNNTTDVGEQEKWGALYNWYALNTGKLAPEGWHVPTDAEWDTLQNYLIANGYNWDGTTSGNKIAKSMAAKTDWSSSSTEGTPGNDMQSNNRTGFSALPGGCRNNGGYFAAIGDASGWWSTTENATSDAYGRGLPCDDEYLFRSNDGKEFGFSVRLVSD